MYSVCVLSYAVQLTGTEVEPDFRGFIIQAISCDDNRPVGAFIEPTDDSEDPQYRLQCGDVCVLSNVHSVYIECYCLMLKNQ